MTALFQDARYAFASFFAHGPVGEDRGQQSRGGGLDPARPSSDKGVEISAPSDDEKTQMGCDSAKIPGVAGNGNLTRSLSANRHVGIDDIRRCGLR